MNAFAFAASLVIALKMKSGAFCSALGISSVSNALMS